MLFFRNDYIALEYLLANDKNGEVKDGKYKRN